ncbi:MAG: molybdopterin-dependent oxidoreductase, partial [Gemmatimonadetes bacterium]|nr:molybdopterin-dependent oxidoreductase [Gemmatimonadota bacterium]
MKPDRWVGAPRALRGLVEPADRRGFFRTAGGLLVSATLLAACDSDGPESAAKWLAYAEKKNEGLERALFRHTRMGSAPASLKPGGDEFPSYFIADETPTWDEATKGPWRLTVNGLVERPLSLSLAELAAIGVVTQRVPHFCVEGWTAVAEFSGVRVSALAKAAGAKSGA